VDAVGTPKKQIKRELWSVRLLYKGSYCQGVQRINYNKQSITKRRQQI